MKNLVCKALAAITAISAICLASPLRADALNPAHVLVLPFTPTGNTGPNDWIGKGVQQSLLADLSGVGGIQLVFSTTQPAQNAQDPGDSIALAAHAGANLVVIGNYQVNGDQLRITGQVYDVAAGKALGGVKATGTTTDLFKLEDSLNDQLQHVLPVDRSLTPTQPVVVTTRADDTSTGNVSTASYTVVSAPPAPQNVYVYPTSTYYYGSSYYPTYYPYFATPIYSIGCSPFICSRPFCSPVCFRGGGFCGTTVRVGFGGGFHGGGGFGGGFHGGGHR